MIISEILKCIQLRGGYTGFARMLFTFSSGIIVLQRAADASISYAQHLVDLYMVIGVSGSLVEVS